MSQTHAQTFNAASDTEVVYPFCGLMELSHGQ
jgi:hypothetical protein